VGRLTVSGHTFRVSAVEPSGETLPTIDTRAALAALLGEEVAIEACSRGRFVADPARGWRWHPFIAAADCAFNRHLPLALGPDAVWLCIAQGVAAAIRASARREPAGLEAAGLEAAGLEASGRDLLEIRRDDWLRGDPDNPWPSIFDDFVAAIGARTPAAHELVMASFSTTGVVERAAFAVTLMDAMQDYFAYRGTSLCGIPAMRVRGTAGDYQAIRARVARLAEHGLGWWVPALEVVCDRLAAAAAGAPDVGFFRSFYKRDEASGGPYMNGWINVLFPFQWSYASKRFDAHNEAAARWAWPLLDAPDEDHPFEGGKQKALPLGLSRAPLGWRVLSPPAEYRYELIAGFVGAAQDPETSCLEARIGWAVRALA
jgi:hypothetical protein